GPVESNNGTQIKQVNDQSPDENKKPHLNDLLKLFKSYAAQYKVIGVALSVPVDDLLPIPGTATHNLICVFERWIASNEEVSWRKVLQVCDEYPEEFRKAKAEVEGFIDQPSDERPVESDNGTQTKQVNDQSSDENILDKEPKLKDLHRLFDSSAAHYSTIGTALDVEVEDLSHSEKAVSDKLRTVFKRWIDSNKGVTWRNALQVCEDYPDKFGKVKACIEKFLTSDRARENYKTNNN
uniref:Death domain-containing protein n=1 Tax=Amphimedon queenslandica TaxID=400682 RepID=A0A1X7TG75_AMPQE